MKRIKNIFLLILLFLSFNSLGQANEVEMADVLRQDGKIYTVVAGIVLILTAMIILLIRVDRKVFRLEKQMEEDKQEMITVSHSKEKD